MKSIYKAFNTDEFKSAKLKNLDLKKSLEEVKGEIKNYLSRLDQLIETGFSLDSKGFGLLINFLEFEKVTIDTILTTYSNIHSADTSDAINELAPMYSDVESSFNNSLLFHDKLANVIKDFFQNKEKLSLDAEEQTILKKFYDLYELEGAFLVKEKKDRLRILNSELSDLQLKFSLK